MHRHGVHKPGSDCSKEEPYEAAGEYLHVTNTFECDVPEGYPEDYSAILHPGTSQQTLRKHLVQLHNPIVYDAVVGRKHIQAFLDGNIVHDCKPGASALAAKDVWKTAAKMLYTENSFTVLHYDLRDFFRYPENTTGLDEPITTLIRHITVIITKMVRRGV
ncbi:hypothetical protein S40288_11550 [Stachybotrys chartarum IBT 40288]|nr:hypothetical protein S40288_11550 [Stachybotrys chartarum IBT 40288]